MILSGNQMSGTTHSLWVLSNSHNLRCKGYFDQILLKSAPSSPPNMMNIAIFLSTTTPRASGWTLRSNSWRVVHVEKNITVFKDAVSLMLLSKKLLFSTHGSQITNDFVWKSKAGNLFIYLNFCQATLSYNLRCKE